MKNESGGCRERALLSSLERLGKGLVLFESVGGVGVGVGGTGSPQALSLSVSSLNSQLMTSPLLSPPNHIYCKKIETCFSSRMFTSHKLSHRPLANVTQPPYPFAALPSDVNSYPVNRKSFIYIYSQILMRIIFFFFISPPLNNV